MKNRNSLYLIGLLVLAMATPRAFAAHNPFIGEWELTIPGGAAGWLGVEEKNGNLEASLMWGAGSVLPLKSAFLRDDHLVLSRAYEVERVNAAGKKVKENLIETITGTIHGDRLELVAVKASEPDEKSKPVKVSGKRQPPAPPAPSLQSLKFGKPISLFNGKDLKGWRVTNPKAVNGWAVQDGLLVNNPVHEDGKPHREYGNLRTDKEFEDFNLKVEVRVEKGQNSGIYLRGWCEVQVADTFGQAPNWHNMGAVYSRIAPSKAAEKPPGEWQTFDITFAQRHVTVVLNGERIIDNQLVKGCTGGALWADASRPGPIYLQGDHTGVTYRKVELTPILHTQP